VQTQNATTVLAGRYVLEEELGRSGTGLVWRAADLLLGRTVAVKLVHPRLGDDPRFAACLGEEVRRMVSLSPPGIARPLTGGEIDARTDVFAVGALLFTLLTGQAPAGRRSPSEARSGLPRPLDRVVARALAQDPSSRFDSVAAFSAAPRPSEVAEPTGAGEPLHGGLRAWLGAPIAIALVAGAVIAAGLWLCRLEVGGPLGIRPADDHESGAASGDA